MTGCARLKRPYQVARATEEETDSWFVTRERPFRAKDSELLPHATLVASWYYSARITPPRFSRMQQCKLVCESRLEVHATENILKTWVRAQRIENWIHFDSAGCLSDDIALFIALF